MSKSITLDNVPEAKARLAQAFAKRNRITLSEALLASSIDGLASQEAYRAFDVMARQGIYPADVVAAAEQAADEAAAQQAIPADK